MRTIPECGFMPLPVIIIRFLPGKQLKKLNMAVSVVISACHRACRHIGKRHFLDFQLCFRDKQGVKAHRKNVF